MVPSKDRFALHIPLNLEKFIKNYKIFMYFIKIFQVQIKTYHKKNLIVLLMELAPVKSVDF